MGTRDLSVSAEALKSKKKSKTTKDGSICWLRYWMTLALRKVLPHPGIPCSQRYRPVPAFQVWKASLSRNQDPVPSCRFWSASFRFVDVSGGESQFWIFWRWLSDFEASICAFVALVIAWSSRMSFPFEPNSITLHNQNRVIAPDLSTWRALLVSWSPRVGM